MLAKTYEWLRVADAKPDDTAVESRKKTVADLLARADQDDGGVTFLVDLVTAAVAGPASVPADDSEFVPAVVDAIRKYNPAFPADLSENALDVRTTCALTVGELVVRSPKKGSASRRALAAALWVSGAGIRPPDGGKYLKAMVAELDAVADKHLQGRAVAVRRRTPFDTDELDQITPPGPSDVVAFWNLLKPTLKSAIDHVQSQANTDREELNVLWWFYNRQAVALGKQLGDLPAAGAAVAAAVEVGDRVTLPPHRGLAPMIVEAVERGRGKTEVSAKPLAKTVASWNADIWGLVTAFDDEESLAPASHPALFPLTWLCARLTESGSPTGWEKEFQSKTGLPASTPLTPGELAAQVFRERVARRLLAAEAAG